MRSVVCSAAAILLILIGFAIGASAQPACPDVTGCWDGTYANSVSGALELVLQQSGDQLSGLLTIHDVNLGTQISGVSGTITCDTLSFTSSFSTSSALVTDDCMAGTFTAPPVGTSGTWQACRVSCCGNGTIQPGETCDDANALAGDGCSDACMVEPGWSCTGQPSSCIQIVCGNGIVQPGEACDDGGTASGDGCSSSCTIESGFTCSGQPSTCIPIVCGNGVVQPGEECDDGNTVAGDCCDADCAAEPAGTACATPFVVSGTCDANGNCIGVAIPTLSQWGIAVMSLLTLAMVLYRRRPGTHPT